jgi:prevent-host-death family protein
MKTATVRDLRNHYTDVLRWISAGEDVLITRRGKVVARLVPESAPPAQTVDWSQSPAVMRDRTGTYVMTAEESLEIIHEAGGKW